MSERPTNRTCIATSCRTTQDPQQNQQDPENSQHLQPRCKRNAQHNLPETNQYHHIANHRQHHYHRNHHTSNQCSAIYQTDTFTKSKQVRDCKQTPIVMNQELHCGFCRKQISRSCIVMETPTFKPLSTRKFNAKQSKILDIR